MTLLSKKYKKNVWCISSQIKHTSKPFSSSTPSYIKGVKSRQKNLIAMFFFPTLIQNTPYSTSCSLSFPLLQPRVTEHSILPRSLQIHNLSQLTQSGKNLTLLNIKYQDTNKVKELMSPPQFHIWAVISAIAGLERTCFPQQNGNSGDTNLSHIFIGHRSLAKDTGTMSFHTCYENIFSPLP